MRHLNFLMPLFLLLSGCAGRTAEGPAYDVEYETQDGLADDDAIPADRLPYLQALQSEVKWTDGQAWRKFSGKKGRYRVIPDTVYPVDRYCELVLFRCIEREVPCSHAEAAFFQIIEYNTAWNDLKVLRQSDILPLYSPWCDKLRPRLIRLKGVPHLLFEMDDVHQGTAHSEYWMISAGPENFGSLVWHEDVYTSTYSMGDSDAMRVFEEEVMEATVEFDVTRCAEGIWIMNVSKTITKRLSNASIGEPSPESEERVRNTPPMVKESEDKRVYRMDSAGRLVEE